MNKSLIILSIFCLGSSFARGIHPSQTRIGEVSLHHPLKKSSISTQGQPRSIDISLGREKREMSSKPVLTFVSYPEVLIETFQEGQSKIYKIEGIKEEDEMMKDVFSSIKKAARGANDLIRIAQEENLMVETYYDKLNYHQEEQVKVDPIKLKYLNDRLEWLRDFSDQALGDEIRPFVYKDELRYSCPVASGLFTQDNKLYKQTREELIDVREDGPGDRFFRAGIASDDIYYFAMVNTIDINGEFRDFNFPHRANFVLDTKEKLQKYNFEFYVLNSYIKPRNGKDGFSHGTKKISEVLGKFIYCLSVERYNKYAIDKRLRLLSNMLAQFGVEFLERAQIDQMMTEMEDVTPEKFDIMATNFYERAVSNYMDSLERDARKTAFINHYQGLTGIDLVKILPITARLESDEVSNQESLKLVQELEVRSKSPGVATISE